MSVIYGVSDRDMRFRLCHFHDVSWKAVTLCHINIITGRRILDMGNKFTPAVTVMALDGVESRDEQMWECD